MLKIQNLKFREKEKAMRTLILTPINGISALTKLFFARKPQKIISNLLTPINGISKFTKLFSAKKPQKIISNLLIKNLALTTAVLSMNVTNAWALEAVREDNSDLFVWIFLAFCALIVIAQLIPAIMMMLGVARGVKKETLQVAPAVADHDAAPAGDQYESEVQ